MTIRIAVLAGVLSSLLSTPGAALAAVTEPITEPITEQRQWTETWAVTAASPRLEVRNIWGSVRVTTGRPGRIVATITEQRSAPDETRFERSLEVLGLETQADASGVSLVVGEREDCRRRNDCDGCRVDYQFEIEVPPNAVVDVGTVMDGRIDIEDVAGTVSASNVNGPIRIAGLRDCEAVSRVNGPVTLGFGAIPSLGCRIETVNGDVTLEVPAGTGLDVALDLFNGEVSSELPVAPFEVPATVEKIVDDGRKRYRIEKLAGMRVGAGGPTYSVASMNGDLLIRKHQ